MEKLVFWIESHQKHNRSVISCLAWDKEREWWLGITINGLENMEFIRLSLLLFYFVGFENKPIIGLALVVGGGGWDQLKC